MLLKCHFYLIVDYGKRFGNGELQQETEFRYPANKASLGARELGPCQQKNILVPFRFCVRDGAYHFYCAHVLRISRYSGFLWVVPTNTGIFLRGLKLCGESRT